MDNEILEKLMKEVDNKLDGLLKTLADNQDKINKLHDENKQLKDNYAKILEQISIYVDELEEIKKLQK